MAIFKSCFEAAKKGFKGGHKRSSIHHISACIQTSILLLKKSPIKPAFSPNYLLKVMTLHLLEDFTTKVQSNSLVAIIFPLHAVCISFGNEDSSICET